MNLVSFLKHYIIINSNLLIRIFICLAVFLLIFYRRKTIVNKGYRLFLKYTKLVVSKEQEDEVVRGLRSFEWLLITFTINVIYLILLKDLPLFLHGFPFKLVYMLLMGGIIASIIDFVFYNIMNNKNKVIDVLDKTMIYMSIKVLKAVVWIVIVVMCLDELGYNISTLIAGLGVSGLAVALAAQDTVSNLFGCVVILIDKPFHIGDWIQTNDIEGIVENISFRSTRIRTFQNALIVIPNSSLANAVLTNWSMMEKRKLRFYVGLTYNTPADVIRVISDEIKAYLKELPSVEKDSSSVFLEVMNTSSIDLRVDATILRKNINDYLSEKEKINYAIIKIVEKHQSSFAFPTQSIYIESLPKND